MREEEKTIEGFHKTVMYCVNDRSAATLGPIIRKHIRPNSLVHHDGWKGYGPINWGQMRIKHKEHVHRVNGVMQRTMYHCNQLKVCGVN